MDRFILFIAVFVVGSCSRSTEDLRLFTRLRSQDTGIRFVNKLEVDSTFDVFRYRNYYNGGGVAIGDVNNDGLPDIYLTANQTTNKLYLNKGNFEFEDVTEQAGVGGSKFWSTGVSFADVNGDGFLDIYVCNSGNINGDDKANELFINSGNVSGAGGPVAFKEAAEDYGLDDKGYSTHGAFFDYDNDGDLDLYLLNNSFIPVVDFIKHGYKNTRHERDSLGGDKLYRNDDGTFKDVTGEAGIYSSVIGFGLGVTVGDINADGWLDIYVSNDFFERDYLYMNQGNGTFLEQLEEKMGHISFFSMGADMADINNDGYPEIFVTDMMPEDELRRKQVVGYESYDVYQSKIRQGYYHQYMRNMLHLNMAVPGKEGSIADRSFIEIGQISNVHHSDWSWGALIADFNNDGLKDIFVDNGIYKDVINRDFIDFFANEQISLVRKRKAKRDVNFSELLERIPNAKLNNYLFINQDGRSFQNRAHQSGIDDLTYSNGASYGDLDNDGDLDLVVNNVNMEPSIYRNNATEYNGNNYLSVALKNTQAKKIAIGSKVTVYARGQLFYQELMPSRGFQSSSDYRLIFGLGGHDSVDSLEVVWPDGSRQVVVNPDVNQHITVNYANDKTSNPSHRKVNNILSPLFRQVDIKGLTNFIHQEDQFLDFDLERLIPHKMSMEGPAFTGADVNNDGIKDFYVGGAGGFRSHLYISSENGFVSSNDDLFKAEARYEDIDAAFFDFDNDGDLDLYVGSGGNQFPHGSPYLYDRLYLNGGMGTFSKAVSVVPEIAGFTSTVQPGDFDNDGDIDIFIGSRVVPGKYGETPRSYLFINDNGKTFKELTSQISFNLGRVGMVTDATWSDYDNDNDEDLIIVGEWMGIKVFNNDNGNLSDISGSVGLDNTNGWWNTIHANDLDQDGDIDFIVGNRGENSFLKASVESPLKLYVNDFDQNGSWEPIISYTIDGKSYPLPLKDEITRQINSLKKKYLRFEDYAGQTMNEIFTEEQLNFSIVKEIQTFSTLVLINDAGRGFTLKPLPFEAQLSPTNAIFVGDYNSDGIKDIMLGGNFFGNPTKFGRFDANIGQILIGDRQLNYNALDPAESGFFHKQVVKDIELLNYKTREYFVLAFNNDSLKVYELLKTAP